MVCFPFGAVSTASGDEFGFSAASDPVGRGFENVAVLLSAPWRAYWALAFEALDPSNYRF